MGGRKIGLPCFPAVPLRLETSPAGGATLPHASGRTNLAGCSAFRCITEKSAPSGVYTRARKGIKALGQKWGSPQAPLVLSGFLGSLLAYLTCTDLRPGRAPQDKVAVHLHLPWFKAWPASLGQRIPEARKTMSMGQAEGK